MATPTKYEVFVDGAKDASPAGKERLAQALASNYGLPLEQAKRVVAGGHFRVKRDVELQMARRYVSHLEGLGARASLAECGPRAATTSSPDLRAAAQRARAAAAPTVAAPKVATPAPAAAPAPGARVAPAAPAPAPAGAGGEVVDEFSISISGLMTDPGAAAPAAPAAPPQAPAPPFAVALPPPRPVAPAPGATRPAAPAPAAKPAAAPPRPAAPAPAAKPAAAPPPPLNSPAPGIDAGGFSVVTLDGEGDGPLELERGDAGGAGAFAPPGAGDEFLPPDDHEGNLELVHDQPRPQAGVKAAAAPIVELNAPIEEVPLSDEKLSASSQSFALDEAPPPPGTQLKAAPPPRPTAPPPPLPPPSARPAAATWPLAGGGTGYVAPAGGLFGGRIRQRLVTRVLLGVALSVVFSFVPASLYASHAHSTTIRALQLEERELGEKPPLSATAQARTPAVVRQEIGSARTRAFVVTLFLWMTMAAVLGFLWYRFV